MCGDDGGEGAGDVQAVTFEDVQCGRKSRYALMSAISVYICAGGYGSVRRARRVVVGVGVGDGPPELELVLDPGRRCGRADRSHDDEWRWLGLGWRAWCGVAEGRRESRGGECGGGRGVLWRFEKRARWHGREEDVCCARKKVVAVAVAVNFEASTRRAGEGEIRSAMATGGAFEGSSGRDRRNEGGEVVVSVVVASL